MRAHWHVIILSVYLVLLTDAAVTDPIDLFIAGEPPLVNNYRIPSLARTGRGTLVAVAEARSSAADCCYKWLAFRRSTDNGTTWSPVAEVWGQQLSPPFGAGNPVLVFDNVTSNLILHGSVNDLTHCSPTLYTFSIDDGGTDGAVWGNLRNLTSFLGQYDGATPGPGTGTQLGPLSVAPGRLIVPAHYGVYNEDVSWYSDDHGATWNLSSPALVHLDEVVTAALPSGTVLLNARTDHYNSTCKCRAVTRSRDGGATWETPVQWDSTLIEPVCQGSMVTLGPLQAYEGQIVLLFSNPASSTERANLTIRASFDEGFTWSPNTWLVQPGEMWGGYNCMANGKPLTRADGEPGTEYGAIVWERARPSVSGAGNGEDINVISFALFPAKGW